MKRIIIILLICFLLLLAIGIAGHSRICLVDINKLYNLKYGVRIIPIIKQLCLIKAKDYLYGGTELIDTNKNLLLAYVSLEKTPVGDELNYTDALVLTGYAIIRKNP